MQGTLVNAAAIVAGSVVGLLLRGGLKENYRNIINQAVALSVLFVGISGCLKGMLEPGSSPILFIVALVAGGVLGEGLRIEGRLEALGDWLQARLLKNGGAADDDTLKGGPASALGAGASQWGNLSKGFVAASLLFCVGTMAVLGSLESGIRGNHSILYAKSLLDGIFSIVMASSLGVGVAFSAVSVLLYQGGITLLAGWVSPYLTADMLRELSIVGGVLITALGLNTLGLTKIKAGNMLPALLVPVVYYAVRGLLG